MLIHFLLDIVKYTIAGSAVFFIAWFVVKEEIENAGRRKALELKKIAVETTLPLRLQAYERMVLFVERINPSSLLLRTHVPGSSVAESQQMLIAEIRNEFQHNITQQIYISQMSWSVISKLKEDTISLINNTAKAVPSDAPAVELSKLILTNMAAIGESPYDSAITLVKEDLQHLFY